MLRRTQGSRGVAQHHCSTWCSCYSKTEEQQMTASHTRLARKIHSEWAGHKFPSEQRAPFTGDTYGFALRGLHISQRIGSKVGLALLPRALHPCKNLILRAGAVLEHSVLARDEVAALNVELRGEARPLEVGVLCRVLQSDFLARTRCCCYRAHAVCRDLQQR